MYKKKRTTKQREEEQLRKLCSSLVVKCTKQIFMTAFKAFVVIGLSYQFCLNDQICAKSKCNFHNLLPYLKILRINL